MITPQTDALESLRSPYPVTDLELPPDPLPTLTLP